MSPEDLATVERSWAELRDRRDDLVEQLTHRYETIYETIHETIDETSHGTIDETSMMSNVRASWLVDAVAELVGLLSAPSRLGERARTLATTWPDSANAPSFRMDGRAWMDAAGATSSSWTERTERAWLHAWLLLSDVLAAEALSPFSDSSVGPASEP